MMHTVTDVGHQQSGDLRHQRRHRLAGGHSSIRGTISTMIIDFAFVAAHRKGNRRVGCRILHLYDVAYCIAGVLSNSRNLHRFYGFV
jgi:hypothetical protein